MAELIRWTWSRFATLALDDLYDALALRCRVFVLEQGAYLDPDGLDRCSWHLLGRAGDGVLHAYLRFVDAGAKYAEPSMGRVITSPERRGSGLGHALVREGLRLGDRAYGGAAMRISAQAHLQPFYARHGFRTVTEPYAEDGIPHVQMLREPRAAQQP